MTTRRRIMAHRLIVDNGENEQAEYQMAIATTSLSEGIVTDITIEPYSKECAGVEFYNGTIIIQKNKPLPSLLFY